MESISVGPAAMKLTYKILGHKSDDLLGILKQLASELGVSNIAYVRMASNKSTDSNLLTTGETTYPREWMRRYFVKQYFLIDPVLQFGITSPHYFDWQDVDRGSPAIRDFFLDAVRHKVGSNGISIPIRNRKNTTAIVSFTSDMSRPVWENFKDANMDKLHHTAVLIDAAAMTGLKFEDLPDVKLSLREEQCLMWAARGKTYEEIGELTNLSFYSVRSHLDLARLKLHGANLTHAVAIALALGVIPPVALRG
jgi:DNA-binding CsgD family transcriptional regulator